MTASMRTALLGFALLPVVAVAAVAQPAHVTGSAPRLNADETAVKPGETLTLRGTGFPRDVHVALLARSPHTEATRIGGARTAQRGRFVATIRIRPRSSSGPLVATACYDSCRVKASVRFRIVAP